MKEYKRLKLVQLTRTELRNKEMGFLKGGAEDKCCGCGYGTANRDANSSAGYSHSSGDTTHNCWRWEYNSKNNAYETSGRTLSC